MMVNVSVFLVSAFLLFFTHSPVSAFQAEVSPYEINPGDAFIIKVTGAETSEIPDASLEGKPFYFSSCGKGCFVSIGAVRLETKPGVYEILLSIGKEKRSLNIVVKRTSFPTVRLTLPEDLVFLSPENLRRAEREEEKLKFLFQVVSERLWRGSFIRPLENEISTIFGTKRILNEKKISIHRGVDIKGKEGEGVKASNSGRVVLAEELFFGGNTVILDHGQGIYTFYMHLSRFNVKLHDYVSKGDIIGFVGSTGRSSDSHLHFGVKVLNINTNPVAFVALKL
jgi:murein DD-endopeptidase MepM/ murein hydrolase activator NlpD